MRATVMNLQAGMLTPRVWLAMFVCFCCRNAAAVPKHTTAIHALQSQSSSFVINLPVQASAAQLFFESTVHDVSLALLTAFARNASVSLSPLSPAASWWQPDQGDGNCRPSNDSCTFQSLRPRISSGAAAQRRLMFHAWSERDQIQFFLSGAGLLWIWEHSWLMGQPSAEAAGCKVAAALVTYLLRLSAELQSLLENVSQASYGSSNGRFVCCTGSLAYCKHMEAANPQLAGMGPILALQHVCQPGTAQHPAALCKALNNAKLHVGPLVHKALGYHLCASSPAIVGEPTELPTKIATLLAYAKQGRMPLIWGLSGQHIVWGDGLGFGSCTSEEMMKQQLLQTNQTVNQPNIPPLTNYNSRSQPGMGYACLGCDCIRNVTKEEIPKAEIPSFDEPPWRLAPRLPLQRDFSPGCSLEVVDQQAASFEIEWQEQESLCCGHGHDSGLIHLQRHPELQACQLIVLTYIGDMKDMLRQPAGNALQFCEGQAITLQISSLLYRAHCMLPRINMTLPPNLRARRSAVECHFTPEALLPGYYGCSNSSLPSAARQQHDA
jgi:hypothetical protein